MANDHNSTHEPPITSLGPTLTNIRSVFQRYLLLSVSVSAICGVIVSYGIAFLISPLIPRSNSIYVDIFEMGLRTVPYVLTGFLGSFLVKRKIWTIGILSGLISGALLLALQWFLIPYNTTAPTTEVIASPPTDVVTPPSSWESKTVSWRRIKVPTLSDLFMWWLSFVPYYVVGALMGVTIYVKLRSMYSR